MKLKSESKVVGFYESFSDLIFATMAIFVLLMIVFVVLVQESSPIGKAKKQLEAIKEQIEETKAETLEAEEEAKAKEAEIAKLAKRNIEIVIAVDKSGSMEEELRNLAATINELAQILPKISEDVRIGVVAYRTAEDAVRDQTSILPMYPIVDAEKDQGRSLSQLRSFLASQRAVSGLAPTLKATKKSLSLFNQSSDFDGHQVFMLLGDVGPYEESLRGSDVVTNAGRARADQLVASVGQWVKARKDRNIIVLFSGRDEMTTRENPPQRRRKHRTSMELFKRIAVEAGQQDSYTENQSNMLTDFLVAALKRK